MTSKTTPLYRGNGNEEDLIAYHKNNNPINHNHNHNDSTMIHNANQHHHPTIMTIDDHHDTILDMKHIIPPSWIINIPPVVQYSLVAGSSAGIASTVILYPLDVVRTKMQQQVTTSTFTTTHSITNGSTMKYRNDGPFDVVRTTIQKGGIRGLYVGITLPLMAQAIYKGTVFTVSNLTQQTLRERRVTKHSQLSDHFYGGFVGGAVNGALFVTPVEFIRNQLIAIEASTTTTVTSRSSTSSWDIIRHAIRNHHHGILTLWRGVSWTIYRDSIGCGFFFYTMAFCQEHLHPHLSSPTSSSSSPSLFTTIVSGAFAGLAYWMSSLPLDTIKTWVQSSNIVTNHHPHPSLSPSSTALPAPLSILSVARTASPFSVSSTLYDMYQQYGMTGVIRRLYSGWQVAYGRGIPSAAITMTTYTYVYQYVSSTSLSSS